MYEFKLPDLGEGIHEGELLKWYVQEGDTVQEDEDLMDVETDKAAVTIPSPRTGVVSSLNGKVGDTLEVGSVVVVIDDGSGDAAKPAATGKKEEPAAGAQVASPAHTEDKAEEKEFARPAPATPGRPVPAAPATRRLARELGVDINSVHGSGPGGRVLAEDVRAFSEGRQAPAPAESEQSSASADGAVVSQMGQPAPEKELASFQGGAGIPFYELEQLPDFAQQGPVEREDIRSIRRKVAKKMTTSMILVPHVAHMDEADVTELEAFRREMKQRHSDGPGGKLTLLPIMMKALASLLRRYPQFNASLDPHRQEIIYKKFYNFGFAADTPRGLVVPVVKDVDKKSILEISAEIVELAAQAREGEINAADLRGSTITITNIGPIGGTGLIPTINYPEVAILGMGRSQDKPVVREGEIVVRNMLPLTLAFDHRVADGAQAARMVTELVGMLADPKQMLLSL